MVKKIKVIVYSSTHTHTHTHTHAHTHTHTLILCLFLCVLSSTWSTGTPTSTVCSRRQWSKIMDWLLLESFSRYTTHTLMSWLDPQYCKRLHMQIMMYTWPSMCCICSLRLCVQSRLMSNPCVGGEETRGAAETGRRSACYQTQGKIMTHTHTKTHAPTTFLLY